MHAQVPIVKRIVRINVDETSVQLFERELKGNITQRARKQKRQARSLKRDTHGVNTKLSITYVVVICDDYGVQKTAPSSPSHC